LMEVREIRTIGDPVLRERAREVEISEISGDFVQSLIDDMVETMRAAGGAGLAANQVGERARVAVAEVQGSNPRYPYKPPIPLTVMINPELETLGEETLLINEGCLSIPDLRGDVKRHVDIRVRYLDRRGERCEQLLSGLTAGTFQHEVDHLDGILIVDRADPHSLATWEQFERHGREAFLERIASYARKPG
jgi:peptide deformylase